MTSLRHILALVLGLAGPAAAAPSQEDLVWLQMLHNADLTESARPGLTIPPWWQVVPGLPPAEVHMIDGGVRELRTSVLAGGVPQALRQPIAAHPPLAGEVVIRGRVSGRGLVRVEDGRPPGVGGSRDWRQPVASNEESPGGFEPFELSVGSLVPEGEAPAVPRLRVSFLADPTGAVGSVATWRDLEVLVPLPCPGEAALREQVVALLREHFGHWHARALDDVGVPHPFVVRAFDATTGEVLGAPQPGSELVLYEDLHHAWRYQPDPEWEAWLVEWGEAWLELCFHPVTGLPRSFHPVEDLPLDDVHLEPHRALALLVDLVEHGPDPLREPAREVAARALETLLATGVLPDGNIAAVYRPRDGEASTSVPEIRYLNVPAQLTRLGALLSDDRPVLAARGAVRTLEYTHHWPGDWRSIDPGFDDIFGTLGTAAMAMWRAHETWDPGFPPDPFASLVVSGWDTYGPLWRDALRYGGNVAADQVRCWHLAADLAALAPARRDEIGPLLMAAARSHFRGQQVEGGLWIDVTIDDFDPKANLGVGDVVGLPQNLLGGLGAIYDAELVGAQNLEELRAMFAAALQSTLQSYQEPYGLRSRLERGSVNPAEGSLRLTAALVEMLESLTP